MSKFHINKHGVPAPCKAQSGNCPLGGDSGNENHFETQEEAQEHADEVNQKEHGITPEMVDSEEGNTHRGSYVGNYYTMPEKAGENLSKSMNESNVKEVFDDGFKDGDITTTYETDSFNNTTVEFDAKISKIGENEYHVKGEMREHSGAEDDFDTKEEYEEYLDGEPESHDIDYKFTGDDLKKNLVERERLGTNGTHHRQTPGVVMSGIYDMSREGI